MAFPLSLSFLGLVVCALLRTGRCITVRYKFIVENYPEFEPDLIQQRYYSKSVLDEITDQLRKIPHMTAAIITADGLDFDSYTCVGLACPEESGGMDVNTTIIGRKTVLIQFGKFAPSHASRHRADHVFTFLYNPVRAGPLLGSHTDSVNCTIVVPSEQTKSDVVGRGFPSADVFVLPYGVETNVFRPLQLKEKIKARSWLFSLISSNPEDTIVLFFAGKMVWGEGIDVLLHSFVQFLNNVELSKNSAKKHVLLLKGFGKRSRDRLETAVKDTNGAMRWYKSGNILFLDTLFTSMDWVNTYNSVDAYISPHRLHEYSDRILEALSCGTVVIHTNQYFKKRPGYRFVDIPVSLPINSTVLNTSRHGEKFEYFEPSSPSLTESLQMALGDNIKIHSYFSGPLFARIYSSMGIVAQIFLDLIKETLHDGVPFVRVENLHPNQVLPVTDLGSSIFETLLIRAIWGKRGGSTALVCVTLTKPASILHTLSVTSGRELLQEVCNNISSVEYRFPLKTIFPMTAIDGGAHPLSANLQVHVRDLGSNASIAASNMFTVHFVPCKRLDACENYALNLLESGDLDMARFHYTKVLHDAAYLSHRYIRLLITLLTVVPPIMPNENQLRDLSTQTLERLENLVGLNISFNDFTVIPGQDRRGFTTATPVNKAGRSSYSLVPNVFFFVPRQRFKG